jgi:hypothetical protein
MSLLPTTEQNADNSGLTPPLTLDQIFQKMKGLLGQGLNYHSEVTATLREPVEKGVILEITTPTRYELAQPDLMQQIIASNTIRLTDIGSPGYLRILLGFCLGNGVAKDTIEQAFPNMLVPLTGELTGSEVASATGLTRATNHLITGAKHSFYTTGAKKVGKRTSPSYRLTSDERVLERLRTFVELIVTVLQ